MIEALRDAGPPCLTLLIVLFAGVAYVKAPEIRAFWRSVFFEDA